MKTRLPKKHFSFFLMLSALFLTINTAIAQTIAPAIPIPDSSEVGTSVPLTFNYTSTEACKIRVDLWIVDIDGDGNINNTYCCYQAGEASATLPASAEPASGSVTINLPGNLALSSELASGTSYAWDYKLLRDSDSGYITGAQTATSIVGSSSVLDLLSLDNTPATVQTGSTVTVTVNYTCPESRLIKFGISKYSSSGSFINDLVGLGVDNLPETTTTPVSLSQDLVIPADAVASADLTNGEYYKVDTALFTPGFASYISGASQNITITSALGVNDFSKRTLKIAPNPVSSILSINEDLEFNTISIYDIVGKKVLAFEKSNLSEIKINVSSLDKGMYFLITNTNHKAKFIKD